MAVDLMGAWGQSAGGGFWDDEGGDAGNNATNDYVNTEIDIGEEEKVPNPGSFFNDEEDPYEYMKAYDKLKSDIRKIEQNGRSIQKLSERYNSSTEKQQNQ